MSTFMPLVAAGVALVGFRLHAFGLPLETDECNYAYIARRLLAGDRLYVDVWDHQPFGVFTMLAGVIALFGDAPHVFRWTACVFSLVSLVLIVDLSRRMAGRWAAVLAAFLFALVSSDPGTAGEGCQREIYMNTLILAAWWWALRWTRGGFAVPVEGRMEGAWDPSDSGRGLAGLFVSGLMLGIASSFKTVVAVHWLALATWLLFARRNADLVSLEEPRPHGRGSVPPLAPEMSGRRELPQGRGIPVGRIRVWRLVAFSAGPAVVWGGAVAYFAVTGRWHDCLDAVFLFNVGYSEGGGLLERFVEFFAPLWHRVVAPIHPSPRFPFTFDSALPLWLVGFAGTAVLAFGVLLGFGRGAWRGVGSQPRVPGEMGLPSAVGDGADVAPVQHRDVTLLLGLVAASYLATCLPGRFWPHYYYLMVPSLVLAAVMALAWVGKWWAVPTLPRPDGDERSAVPTLPRSDGDERSAESTPRQPDGDERPAVPTLQERWPRRLRERRIVTGTIAVLLVVWVGASQYRHYLSQPLFGLTVHRFNSRDFWGRAQGENVASVTDPGDTIFVFGNDAEIYYYAGRRCASRYTMITGLSGKLPGAEERREILMRELRRDPPRVILVLFDEPPFPEWRDFLHDVYGEPVGWDFHDRTQKPILLVLARKDRPIRAIDWNWDRAAVGGWAIGER